MAELVAGESANLFVMDMTAERPWWDGYEGPSTTWHVEHLTPVACDVGSTGRVGHTIRQQKLVFKGRLYLNPNPSTLNISARIIVIKGLKPYVATPDIAQILEDTSNPMISFYNREEIKDWRVLWDHVFLFDVFKPIHQVVRRINLGNRVQTFSGVGTTDGKYGDIYILAISSTPENDVTYNFEAGFYFTDI